nr:MAG TPA: hypothetical protein [Caudoviricetes sp.]
MSFMASLVFPSAMSLLPRSTKLLMRFSKMLMVVLLFLDDEVDELAESQRKGNGDGGVGQPVRKALEHHIELAQKFVHGLFLSILIMAFELPLHVAIGLVVGPAATVRIHVLDLILFELLLSGGRLLGVLLTVVVASGMPAGTIRLADDGHRSCPLELSHAPVDLALAEDSDGNGTVLAGKMYGSHNLAVVMGRNAGYGQELGALALIGNLQLLLQCLFDDAAELVHGVLVVFGIPFEELPVVGERFVQEPGQPIFAELERGAAGGSHDKPCNLAALVAGHTELFFPAIAGGFQNRQSDIEVAQAGKVLPHCIGGSFPAAVTDGSGVLGLELLHLIASLHQPVCSDAFVLVHGSHNAPAEHLHCVVAGINAFLIEIFSLCHFLLPPHSHQGQCHTLSKAHEDGRPLSRNQTSHRCCRTATKRRHQQCWA